MYLQNSTSFLTIWLHICMHVSGLETDAMPLNKPSPQASRKAMLFLFRWHLWLYGLLDGCTPRRVLVVWTAVDRSSSLSSVTSFKALLGFIRRIVPSEQHIWISLRLKVSVSVWCFSLEMSAAGISPPCQSNLADDKAIHETVDGRNPVPPWMVER